MIVQNTICSTSFFAAAWKKLCGTVCSSIPDTVVLVAASVVPCSAEPLLTSMPLPGLTRFTAASPTTSASVVTISK